MTYLEQGWTQETVQRWYYASQGTIFIPYEWFLALEQAQGEELFSSAGNMGRMGFLVDPPHPTYNPDGLPVGFAKMPLEWSKGIAACWQGNWLGFGCAACHTGEVEYRGRRIRIEGGAAHHDIETFQRQLGAAVSAAAGSGVKFERFARRVLARGAGGSPDQLAQSFRCYAEGLRKKRTFFEIAQAQAPEIPTASGYGRLDAHERGVNLFLAAPLNEPRNYVPETAPVSFPAMWDTPYFDWVLYNAAIRQPLTRNIIEALGVQAPLDHSTIFTDRVEHAVNVDNIVSGQRDMMDLRSPQWPEQILGAIDEELAQAGKKIYADNCLGCHQLIDRETHEPLTNPSGAIDHKIKIPSFPLAEIGTDPRQAVTFEKRTVTLSQIGGPDSIPSKDAGQVVTEKVAQQWIAESEDNARRAAEINQGRPNVFRAPLAYRARPLNGIWAMAPYLHNGSVPDLHELLIPPPLRRKTFHMGSWEFDPQRVGFETRSPFPGSWLFDTRLAGNSNAGHDFGTDLSREERAALIEYLKTL